MRIILVPHGAPGNLQPFDTRNLSAIRPAARALGMSAALPFHMICDWGTKPLPFTISTTDSVLPGMGSGESELIRGCGTVPGQLLKLTIALQVDQPDNSRVRTAMKAIRTEGKGLQGLTRQEHIPASLLPTFLIVASVARPRHTKQPEQAAQHTFCED